MWCYWLETVKNHRLCHSQTSRGQEVWPSLYRDFGRQLPKVRYNKHRKKHWNKERGRGDQIAQNGQGAQLCGDVAGQQNLCATHKEAHAHNTQLTAAEYILHMEEIVKSSLSLCQHDSAAAFILSGRSSLPPAMSARTSQEDEIQ